MHSGVLYRSHRGIPPFRLHRPRAVAEALAALAAARGPAAYLAGGVDLVPAMRSDARVTEVIFLGGIAELTTIRRQNGTLHVGAGVSHERFARDARVAEGLPQLPALWRRLGNIRVRLAGTIGGNMMAAKPTYDVLPVLLSLDAKVTFTSLDSAGAPRTITTEPSQRPAPGALLQHIEIPAGSRRYIGFDRSLKPVVSLALAVEETPSGLAGRAAVGCAYPAPVCRPLELSGGLDWGALGARATEVARAFAGALAEPTADWIASAGHRRRMIEVLLTRQLRRASAEGPPRG